MIILQIGLGQGIKMIPLNAHSDYATNLQQPERKFVLLKILEFFKLFAMNYLTRFIQQIANKHSL